MKHRIRILLGSMLVSAVAALLAPAVSSANPPLGIIYRSGHISSNETWTSNNVYVIDGNLTIDAGVTLTIGEGTVVKLRYNNSNLIVDGALVVNGLSQSKVYLTSFKDDTVGGDTNGDGGLSSPAPGDWDRLYFRDGSAGTLNYVELRYGGDFGYGLGMLHTDIATVTVNHGKFVSSAYSAISSNAASEVTLSNMTSDDFTGNRYNGLGIQGGSLNTSATWDESEVAYALLDDLAIGSGVTLTWGPGIVVKLIRHDHDVQLEVHGTLNVNGTANSKVYVTSLKDDTVGGNTDGVVATPAPGDWHRLYFRDGSAGTLNYLELRYGGDFGYGLGMLHTDIATVTVNHGKFVSSAYSAISSNAASEVTLSNMTSDDFTGNRYNGLGIRGGSLNTSATWDESEVAYILLDDLAVGTGVTLTWGPGVVVKPVGYYVQLELHGTLNVNGTAGSKVYVTSLKDDTVGGNTDGVVATPAPGDWDRLYFRDGSAGTLNFVELRYGGATGYGGIHAVESSPSIRNCVIRNNVRGLVSNGAAANPSIHNCLIYDNSQYGVYNATSGHWIDATNNWWGSDGGPYDPSNADGQVNNNPSGDKVSDYVRYAPWTIAASHRVYLPRVLR